jgi:hypothetical protein
VKYIKVFLGLGGGGAGVLERHMQINDPALGFNPQLVLFVKQIFASFLGDQKTREFFDKYCFSSVNLTKFVIFVQNLPKFQHHKT